MVFAHSELTAEVSHASQGQAFFEHSSRSIQYLAEASEHRTLPDGAYRHSNASTPHARH